MSGSAKAGTIAERHTCELRVLTGPNSARSSEARFRRIFFSLTKTYMDVGNPDTLLSHSPSVPLRVDIRVHWLREPRNGDRASLGI